MQEFLRHFLLKSLIENQIDAARSSYPAEVNVGSHRAPFEPDQPSLRLLVMSPVEDGFHIFVFESFVLEFSSDCVSLASLHVRVLCLVENDLIVFLCHSLWLRQKESKDAGTLEGG